MTTSGPASGRTGKPKVLIVDDDTALCDTWQRILALSGYDAISVHDGNEVMATARAYQPDVVVLDVKLPGIDGITLCGMLKADPATSRLKVLLCSGHVDVDLERARGIADSVARKPVPPGLLLASLSVLTSLAVHEGVPAR